MCLCRGGTNSMKKLNRILKQFFLFNFLFIITCSSCITITGLKDDFDKLNEKEKSLIHKFSPDVELIEGNVYLINAQQLKNELAKHEKSIVYCFTNGCSSEKCEPINNYIEYAEENGYKLFLVMNGFGNISATLDQSAPTPYYAIDGKFYNSRYRSKYTRRFENDLLSKPLDFKEKEYKGNLFFFEGINYIETKNKLKN